MPKRIVKPIYRIIDANYNRLKEGLRVCEDILRFAFSDKELTSKIKKLRHQVTDALKKESFNFKDIIITRDSGLDVGRQPDSLEARRGDITDIFYANLQRSKESIRVLEEFFKLINKDISKELKLARYKLYELEKKIITKLPALSHS